MIETIIDIIIPKDIYEWIGLLFIVVWWSMYVKIEVIDKRVWNDNKFFSVLFFVGFYLTSLIGYNLIKMLEFLLL